MNTDDRTSLFVPISGLLLVLASIGGLILYEKPFQSQRPSSQSSSNQSFFQDEDQPARLWQDPLLHVLEPIVEESRTTIQKKRERRRRFVQLREKIRKKIIDDSSADRLGSGASASSDDMQTGGGANSQTAKSPPNLVMIPVMIPGGSYAEAAEVRRRTRQAIVSALAIKGYVPESGQHIGHIETEWKEPGYLSVETPPKENQYSWGSSILGLLQVPKVSETETISIPYEWFARDALRPTNQKGKYKAALILWLNEDAFSKFCLLKLNELFNGLLPQADASSLTFAKRIENSADGGAEEQVDLQMVAEDYLRRREKILDKVAFRFIGPSDSTTLRDLLSRNSWLRFQGFSGFEKTNVDEVLGALDRIVRLLKEDEDENLKNFWIKKELDSFRKQNAIIGSRPPTEEEKAAADKYKAVQQDIRIIEDQLADFVFKKLPPKYNNNGLTQTRKVLQSVRSWSAIAEHSKQMKEGNPAAVLKDSEFVDRLQKSLVDPLEYDLRQTTLNGDFARHVVSSWVKSLAVRTLTDTLVSSTVNSAPNILQNRLEVYSYRATAPESLLVQKSEFIEAEESKEFRSLGIANKTIKEFLQDVYKVKYVSTVVPDDQLGLAMIEELQRRGVSLVSGRKHVVLVSEWDTFYGRAIPFATSAIIQYHRAKSDLNWPPDGALKLMLDGSISHPPRVHRYSYMRGIDGAVPGRNQEKKSSKESSASDSLSSPIEQYEQPVGNSGLDYMRRLSVELTKLERELKAKGEQVGAIGVVGSDVYDKLLVLQALRRKFPRAVFFTTDLDARLLHPSQYDWCRNLIIGSSYGLVLQDQLQEHITPFRDNYQSSAFLAGLLSLGGIEIDTKDPEIAMSDELRKKYPDKVVLNSESDLTEFLKPRIYEVGKNGAYDITPKKYWSPIHPKTRSGLPKLRTLIWMISLIAIVVLLVVPVTPGIRNLFMKGSPDDEIHQQNRSALMVFFILLVLFLIGFWATAFIDSMDGEGEPFEFFEGISIWPSEFLRILMVLLSWVFMSNAISKIWNSDQRLKYELLGGAEYEESTGTSSKSFWQYWHDLRESEQASAETESEQTGVSGFVRIYRWIKFEIRCIRKAQLDISIVEWDRRIQKAEGDETDAVTVFNDYCNLGKISNRICRIVPMVVLYFVFGWILKQLFVAGSVPYRGGLALSVDQIMLVLSVGSLVVLTFFVVDATRLCDVFTRSLAGKTSKWCKSEYLENNVRLDRGLSHFEDMAELIDVRVIAKRTEAIGGLITMPFVVLLVGFFSISDYFDYWRLSIVEYIFFGLLLGYAILCGLMLRWSAEKARTKALYRMQSKLSKVHKSRARGKETRIQQLEILIEEIKSLKKGAFSSWSNHPVVRAVLIPFGGIGTVMLVDFLSRIGL